MFEGAFLARSGPSFRVGLWDVVFTFARCVCFFLCDFRFCQSSFPLQHEPHFWTNPAREPKYRRECLIQNFGNTILQKFPLAMVDSSVNLIELMGIGNSTGRQSTVRAQPKWTTFCGPYILKTTREVFNFIRKVMFILVAQPSAG